MKKIIAFLLITSTSLTYSQKNNNDVAVVPIKKIECSVLKKVEPIVPLPSLDLKTSIKRSFSTGNAKLIAVYFGDNIDMSILDKESLYSKSQAEQVLRTFFSGNKVTSFTINHEGKASSLKYYIGTFVSGKKAYRITVNVKVINSKEHISAISIELNE